MGIKFAEDIIKEMDARGTIKIPDNCVAGDDFERWLCEERNKMYDIKISRKISFLLRHKKGYTDDKGYALVSKLIEDVSITYDDLCRIVKEDDKKRYFFSEDCKYIRASQGHSTGVNLELKEAIPPDILYHGTADRFLKSISKEGIKKMSRDYVHLSADKETAYKVGSRHGKPVLLVINARQMVKDGVKFFVSENGVWLVEDVETKYIL